MAGPNFRDTIANLRQPMPLPRKIWLTSRNWFLRVRHLDNCCGHPGEPGC
jgi:hypothetical protein